ncbi:hypothetical protein Poli38472_004274 [Pythium oligandrum]|uniref:Suppressor of forked domain-containing protein n=1 Tax=Pythium oligandrum TaxID=41045 RepID=A0A8K1FMQ0_PYTOL|nr:hypothetical protein Poli38472_004274 [Pythium oligandrum]|eukprot:TMW66509.1 hypothetical protein Poli38472_004274 [Pythium oligandrum]
MIVSPTRASDRKARDEYWSSHSTSDGSTMAEKRARGASDDSSDEDEPIKTPVGAGGAPGAADGVGKRDELSKAWMDEAEDDEEEEDAEWSQLANANGKNGETATPSAHESKRTPRFKRLWTTVEKEPWNTDAWMALMNDVQTFPIDEAREYYEKFFELFPSTGRWWKLYAEHELREKNYDRVQEIIKKSLMQLRCPHMDLWIFYLNFTKVVKVDVAIASNDEEAIRTTHQLMCDAYELAVERVGGSIHAAPLWQSYVSFLQESRDPQAFLAVRKVFHRAVMVPLHNMDAIWRDYEKFERSIPNNEALAQNFFKVFRQKFDAARAVLRDRKKLYDAINLTVLPVPASKKNMRAEVLQMNEWQKLLAFETGNPERLESARWKSRMRFTFELFLSVNRYTPEAWYQYAAFENEAKDPDAATAVFERALEALPDSSLLSFAFADHHELRGDVVSAKAIYEKLIKENVSALAYITYQRFARRALGAKGLNEARTIFRRARKDERDGACSHHVFAAAAMLEFYSDNSDAGREIALKIFELGLKKYIHEPDYVLCYLDFLGHLNDDNNMRSLFEKVLAVMPPELSRPIWDRYVEFEHTMVANGGDLATVAKVEARRALAFPDASHVEIKGLLSITHRYSFLNLRPPSTSDQMFLDKYGVGRRTQVSALEDINGESGDGAFNGALTSGFDITSSGFDSDRPIPGPPLPDFLKEFASLLPLHQPWNGPIADVEHIYRAMLLVDFPPRSQVEFMAQQQQQAMLQQQQAQQQAQQLLQQSGGDDGEGLIGVSNKRPANDIFRARQQQKMAKLA